MKELWQKQNKENKTLNFLILNLEWLTGNLSTSGMETIEVLGIRAAGDIY